MRLGNACPHAQKHAKENSLLPVKNLHYIARWLAVSLNVIPWIVSTCSFYAIEQDGIVLADQLLRSIATSSSKDADRLYRMLNKIAGDRYIRPDLLRSELPQEGVFALYNHKPMGREPYNPIRLLCSFVTNSNRILIVGGGFYKRADRPIQQDTEAMKQARVLCNVVRMLNQRVDTGDIDVEGSELHPFHHDSLQF